MWQLVDGGLEAVLCVAFLNFRLCLAHVHVPIQLSKVVFLVSLRSARVDVSIQSTRVVVIVVVVYFFYVVCCCLG